MTRRAVETLRTTAKTVMASLPRDVRNVVNGCQVYLADLGHVAGRKVLGMARSDGEVVLIDRSFVESHADCLGAIENTLAHELGHIYRSRLHLDDDDDVREEVGCIQLVKSWGFRVAKERRQMVTK